MKNKHIVHAHEEAKIYHNYYKPSFNIIRLLEICFMWLFYFRFISGTGTVARRK